ncbi:MAG: hypothetical protein HY961_00035 [Ignavibacteriae bacterium]|nr:hypothetical protein [Ignavibacteriota bacterium]
MKYFENHIVITTIYVPQVIECLFRNLSKYGHLDSTCVWIVADKKTPAQAKELCQSVTNDGLQVTYLDIEQQDSWGRKHREFYSRIPYNNETRRNIGYLYALEYGCERLISIDDDNWPTDDDDFIGLHSDTGNKLTGQLTSDNIKFHNVCEHLETKPSRHIYPRGFPFKLRDTQNTTKHSQSNHEATIGVTAGLWTKEPDIDAITWLNGNVESIRYTNQDNIVLHHDTWTPINTQNTSVVRSLIPAFFCIPMGNNVPGGRIERYGDIWAGYFLQAALQNTDFYVNIGRPIVEHRRNPHNYLDDLRHEYWGMLLTDWLTDLLKYEFRTTESDTCEVMLHMSDFLSASASNKIPHWCPPEVVDFIHGTSTSINEWIKVCKAVN